MCLLKCSGSGLWLRGWYLKVTHGGRTNRWTCLLGATILPPSSIRPPRDLCLPSPLLSGFWAPLSLIHTTRLQASRRGCCGPRGCWCEGFDFQGHSLNLPRARCGAELEVLCWGWSSLVWVFLSTFGIREVRHLGRKRGRQVLGWKASVDPSLATVSVTLGWSSFVAVESLLYVGGRREKNVLELPLPFLLEAEIKRDAIFSLHRWMSFCFPSFSFFWCQPTLRLHPQVRPLSFWSGTMTLTRQSCRVGWSGLSHLPLLFRSWFTPHSLMWVGVTEKSGTFLAVSAGNLRGGFSRRGPSLCYQPFRSVWMMPQTPPWQEVLLNLLVGERTGPTVLTHPISPWPVPRSWPCGPSSWRCVFTFVEYGPSLVPGDVVKSRC